VEKIRPKKVEVIGRFNVRGGIHTTVKAGYQYVIKLKKGIIPDPLLKH
jgi:NADPH-dependent 7-cyano-7-deazaguanine reductase QueF